MCYDKEVGTAGQRAGRGVDSERLTYHPPLPRHPTGVGAEWKQIPYSSAG